MEFSGCNAHFEGRQIGVLPESLQGSEWPPVAVDTVFSELCFGEFVNQRQQHCPIQQCHGNDECKGELVGALPDFRARNQSTSQDSRQFQLGFKFIF